jgi:AcrR family transcriptional regulator
MITEQQSTPELLLDVALYLFTTKGYHGTSMRDIAKEAELAVSGIYNHYGNKETIFEAVMRRYHPFVRIQDLLPKVEGNTIRERLADTVRRLIASFDSKPESYRLVFIEIVEFDGQHLPIMVNELQPKIMAWIQRLQAAEGQLRVSEPSLLFHWLMTVLFAYSTSLQIMRFSIDIEQFIALYVDGIIANW